MGALDFTLKVRRMSETPTTTTSQKSIAIRLQFVLQYSSSLYCSTFGPLRCEEREILSVLLPFASQYVPPILIAIRLPFVSQYSWENLGGCGRRDVPHLSFWRHIKGALFKGFAKSLHKIWSLSSKHELFAGANLNQSSMWIVLFLPDEKHWNSHKRAKFMNFSCRPFVWFGLPGRLLIKTFDVCDLFMQWHTDSVGRDPVCL